MPEAIPPEGAFWNQEAATLHLNLKMRSVGVLLAAPCLFPEPKPEIQTPNNDSRASPKFKIQKREIT